MILKIFLDRLLKSLSLSLSWLSQAKTGLHQILKVKRKRRMNEEHP
jgi:hypothetical protein